MAAALEADERAQRELLLEWLVRGQSTGQVRTDLPAERLVSWVRLLMDGFLEQIAADSEFTAEQEGPMLREAVRGVLTGFVQTPGARACASHGG